MDKKTKGNYSEENMTHGSENLYFFSENVLLQVGISCILE